MEMWSTNLQAHQFKEMRMLRAFTNFDYFAFASLQLPFLTAMFQCQMRGTEAWAYPMNEISLALEFCASVL